MTFGKKLLFGSLASLLLIAAGLYAFRFQAGAMFLTAPAEEAKQRYLQANPEQTLVNHLKQIEEDAAALSRYEIFTRNSKGVADAAPFLNLAIPWSVANPPSDETQPARLELSAEVDALLGSKNSFVELKPDWQNLKIDFSFFQQLLQFDHWNFDAIGPAYGERKLYRVAEMPLPDFGQTLISWAKLRLLEGRDHNDLDKAFKDTRHLARLVISTETLVGTMSAIAILGVEEQMYESLSPQLRAKVTTKPIPHKDRERARRYFWAQAAFVDMRLTDATFARFSEIPLGLCQRVHAGMESSLPVRRMMKAEWGGAYNRFDQLVQKTAATCRSGYLRQKWQDFGYQGLFESGRDIFAYATEMANGPSTSNYSLRFLSTTIEDIEAHPNVGLPLFYILLGLGEPDFMKFYHAKDETH